MQRLPTDILDRVERVLDYHRTSKYTPQSVRAHPAVLDPATRPQLYRRFPDLPKTAMPTSVMDAPVPAFSLLSEGLSAVPESQLQPPQDLKTLATWLYLSDGLTVERVMFGQKICLRTCPSSGALYPYEIYVAAFGIQGLDPGLYHYNPKEFALRKMRDGVTALNQIKRGRPDLNFLKSVPAALFVSTIFWRTAWRYRQRAYRIALLDAGHLVQNLVVAANGLGIQTMPRLQMNDNTMRELIGLPNDADFGTAEAVHAMIVWADAATHPMQIPPATGLAAPLPQIRREPLSPRYVPYASVVAAHQDCVAPGMPVRDIRPPLTELTPLTLDRLTHELRASETPLVGPPLRQVLLSRRSTREFAQNSISRDQLLLMNRLAFRGGSVLPLLPDGPHVALVRPYWIVNGVVGMDTGVWYYHPPTDNWALVARGEFRRESAFLSVEQPLFGNAAAVCFMAADLGTLLHNAGPDVYRLAHLEAGLVGQRLYLAATALGLGACASGVFYDDDTRTFLGLEGTPWEIIYEMAVGVPGVA